MLFHVSISNRWALNALIVRSSGQVKSSVYSLAGGFRDCHASLLTHTFSKRHRHVPGPNKAGILHGVTRGELNPGVVRSSLPLPQFERIIS
jgi:hypothetical protein